MEFALKSLDRVLAAVWHADAGMAHVVAYGEGVAAARIAGVLEDYAFVAAACLDAWEADGGVAVLQIGEGDCGCDAGAVL